MWSPSLRRSWRRYLPSPRKFGYKRRSFLYSIRWKRATAQRVTDARRPSSDVVSWTDQHQKSILEPRATTKWTCCAEKKETVSDTLRCQSLPIPFDFVWNSIITRNLLTCCSDTQYVLFCIHWPWINHLTRPSPESIHIAIGSKSILAGDGPI